MKKRLIRSVIWLLVLCLMLPVLFACNEQENEIETDSVTDTVVNMIPIIQNKKSDYVIVYDSTDPIGKAAAEELCALFYKQYGISLALRSDKSNYEHEIVVGDTARDADSNLAKSCQLL